MAFSATTVFVGGSIVAAVPVCGFGS